MKTNPMPNESLQADASLWDSTSGLHWKHCKVCNKEFSGRRNKLYCSKRCSHREKMENARAKRGMFTELDAYKTNATILEKFYASCGDKPLSFEKLIAAGYNKDAPLRNARISKDMSSIYYAYGDYAFKTIENEELVVIIKLNPTK